jgi:transcriptional regulator with XRE-family HTH domain
MMATKSGKQRSITAIQPEESTSSEEKNLTKAIGQQIKTMRKQLGLSAINCSKQANISAGMLSKIENGSAQPSLTTLHSLSKTFNVPLASFFKKFDEDSTVHFTPPGEGILIERHGARVGHSYFRLGDNIGKDLSLSPHLIVMTDKSEVFPMFQHSGAEFIYMLEGELVYQHNERNFQLTPGSSLSFEGDYPHGPVELLKLPIKFISVIVQAQPG